MDVVPLPDCESLLPEPPLLGDPLALDVDLLPEYESLCPDWESLREADIELKLPLVSELLLLPELLLLCDWLPLDCDPLLDGELLWLPDSEPEERLADELLPLDGEPLDEEVLDIEVLDTEVLDEELLEDKLPSEEASDEELLDGEPLDE